MKCVVLNLSLAGILAGMTVAGTGPWAAEPLPEVHATVMDVPAVAGQPVHVEYELRWPEDETFWRVAPPELPFDDPSAVLDWTEAAAATRDTHQINRFVLQVKASEAGPLEIPALEFSVFRDDALPKNELAPLKEPPSTWEDGLQVVSDPITLNFQAADSELGGWLAGLAAVAVIALAGILWATRTRSSGADAGEQTATDPRELVHEARKARLDGDFYAFYLSLSKAADATSTAGAKHLADRYRQRAQEIGYGGGHPSDDEMDAAVKSLERELVPRGGAH